MVPEELTNKELLELEQKCITEEQEETEGGGGGGGGGSGTPKKAHSEECS